jgi:hypothetical protein
MAVIALAPAAAHADVEVMPGASRAISHATSASRDTGLLGLALTPYSVLTAGGDVGIVKIQLAAVALRLGFFGLIELESDRPFSGRLPDFIPRENSAFWRAHGGYSVAIAFDDLARRHLGPRGAFEATLSLRHESEHFTGSTGGDTPRFQDVAHIGNFFLADVAVRLPAGAVDVELRLQNKIFVGEASYVVGPGADAIVRWHLSRWLKPFMSTFAEYIVGNDVTYDDGRRVRVPDDYMIRNLTGVILPGRLGDVQIFSAIEIGNGKGLNVVKEEVRWGGGIRLAFF